ncbi:DYW family of nucleic acid deaminases-domain-containing protein [Xylaria sp. FL0933]|nr:DYW family of nucleic acid deaminases-domain-containing protein [Xylaria sp. FL0933]
MPSRAPVEWWDCSYMYVRCPGCQEIHRHGFDGNYEIKEQRVPHCDSSIYHCDDYDIRFPTQYEIDKERALFVAAGSDPTEYFSEKNTTMRPPIKRSGVRKWEEATEKVNVGGIEMVEIRLAVSNMVQGKVEYVRDYIESSSESDIFLHGIDAYDSNSVEIGGSGDTALHLAACENSVEMTRLLLEKGADPNVHNFEGRTPLAEAALWGRLGNVRVLLENCANKDLECFRSGQPLRAIDFARPTDANDEERCARTIPSFREDTYLRTIDRRAIVCLLEDDTDNLDIQNHVLSGSTFIRTPGQGTRLTLLAHFDVPNVQKTIAVLYRGDRFNPIAAMSGWGHYADDAANIQIAGRDWTNDTLRLCKIIGYDLAPHSNDQGELGRFHACHAEKQLIAYFVDKHCFLPCDLATRASSDYASGDADVLITAYTNRANETRKQGHSADELDTLFHRLNLEEERAESSRIPVYGREICYKEKLSNLYSYNPPFGLKTATIMVSRPVCGDCRLFVNHINRCLGLDINVVG